LAVLILAAVAADMEVLEVWELLPVVVLAALVFPTQFLA
jgi:hypothetical protein